MVSVDKLLKNFIAIIQIHFDAVAEDIESNLMYTENKWNEIVRILRMSGMKLNVHGKIAEFAMYLRPMKSCPKTTHPMTSRPMDSLPHDSSPHGQLAP
jgi:hypothetical protein